MSESVATFFFLIFSIKMCVHECVLVSEYMSTTGGIQKGSAVESVPCARYWPGFTRTFTTVPPFVFLHRFRQKYVILYILFRLGLNSLAPPEVIQISLSQEKVWRV